MDDQPSFTKETSVDEISKYAIFSTTLDLWKALKEDEDIEISDEEDLPEGESSNMSFQEQISSSKEESMETSKQETKVEEIDNHLTMKQEDRDVKEEVETKHILRYSPIRAAQTEHTFPRNVRRKLTNSAPSTSSAPATTNRHSPNSSQPSPPLGLNTPTISTTNPTYLSSSPSNGSSTSEGFYNIQINNNDNVNDAGSLERNVSSLNIAFDSPTTRGSPSSRPENRRKISPPRQQHTPPRHIIASTELPQPRPEQPRLVDHFAVPATIPKKTNGNYHNHSFTNYDRRLVPQAPREQEKLLINKHEYTILKEIGRGSSGKVFQVMGHTYGQILALKWIEVKHDEDRKSIMNEIELLKSLDNHDNIVSLLDYSATSSVIFMVMEFGEIDLAQLIQKQAKRAWDINFIKYYWNQMLHAVSTIHQKKIVHSDLKPANFVVVKGWLKLIDFGIAKKVSDDTTNIERIVQVGTINYMSPEALLDINEGRGEAGSLMKLGRPSDVWSLGCILYQMVYGKTPFYHLPLAQKVISIPNPDYEINYPTTISNGDNSKIIEVPPMLLQVLKGCLTRDPLLRPPLTELMLHPFVN